MPALLSDWAIENGLANVKATANKIYLCSQDPTTFTEATSTYALANKDFGVGNATTGPSAGSPNGRKLDTVAFTDGNVTANGTPVAWALVDSVNSRLLVNGSLSPGGGVSSGQSFELPSFIIRMANQ